MTFTQAIKTCFQKYFTFSGRARRPEYWWFFLFLFLGGFVAGLLDSLVFGATEVLDADFSDGTANVQTGNGPLTNLFSLATLIPALAVGWRRMHDTGRNGLYLLYPLIVMAGIGIFGSLSGIFSPEGDVTAISSVSGVIFVIAVIVLLISPLIVLFWLTRPTQPGSNEWGPEPSVSPSNPPA